MPKPRPLFDADDRKALATLGAWLFLLALALGTTLLAALALGAAVRIFLWAS